MNATTALRVSAIFGFAAVALGALGAHGLKPLLIANGTVDSWQTAALYHLVHSVLLLVIAGREPLRQWAWGLCAAGILIFSGSLYVLAFTNVKVLGAITPIGGVCLLASWLSLAWRPRS